ncbi:MAG: hypothetical protein F4X66_02180 [Chloroflexi bacterium]|nr:hypothetical protein [Chloroflexota bacterium]MYE41294.1 hypothetical protein [Chloroflexota bacterium]
MPYIVFNPFFRCSELHSPHSKLDAAAVCFAEMTERYDGEIPVHPITQKYVYAIAAIDRKGNQRDFSDSAIEEATLLGLDPKSLVTKVPGITTFSHVAKLYYEAARLIPITGISLEGILDYQNKNTHFWTTDAGLGQALAFAQQSAFTLELSFKAVLEVLGKLAEADSRKGQPWQTHDLIDLFKLLTKEERDLLERWWENSDTKRQHFNGTFREFLSSSNNLYLKWRYITDLRSADISIDIQTLLSGASFLLSASDNLMRQRSPIKVTSTVTSYSQDVDDSGNPRPPMKSAYVEGQVRSVKIPEGFDPHSLVEVVIDCEHLRHDVTALFYKRNVGDYFRLQGEQVALTGYSREDEPHLLHGPQRLDRFEQSQKEAHYTSEDRTLSGSVYDLKACPPLYGRTTSFKLVLSDETYFTLVECFFLTEQERHQLAEIQHGDQILVTGSVTSLEGKPVVLVRPKHMEKVIESKRSSKTDASVG